MGMQIDHSALAGISTELPASRFAQEQLRRAAAAGFKWPNSDLVVKKVEEELEETREAIDSGDPSAIKAEIGDLLHAVHTLAEFHGVNAEEALNATNAKFGKRFSAVEKILHERGQTMKDVPLKDMIQVWNAQKDSDSVGAAR